MDFPNYQLGTSISQVMDNELLLDITIQNFGTSCTEYEDLKTCRLVCSKWEKLATKLLNTEYWENREFLRLSNNQDLINYANTFPSISRVDRLTTPLQFSCFIIEPVPSPRYTRPAPSQAFQGTQLENFLETFGQGIKSLSLDTRIVPITATQQMSKGIEKYLKKCASSLEELKILILIPNPWLRPGLHSNEEFKIPNLNYLCLTFGDTWGFGRTGQEQNILEMALGKISDQKSVKVCLFQWKQIEQTILMFQKYKQMQNLKVLDMTNPTTREIRALSLIGRQLKLQFLGVKSPSVHARIQYAQSFHDLLCTQAKNLEILTWESIGAANFGFFKFPVAKMELLKKLKLSWDRDGPSRRDGVKMTPEEENWRKTCPPIMYEHMFPQLEELILTFAGDVLESREFLPQVLGPQCPCSSLRSFEILHYSVNAQLLRTISDTFPLITTLKIGSRFKWGLGPVGRSVWHDELTVEFFSTLWKFTMLQELSLEMDFDMSLKKGRWREYELDSLFSGVDEDIIAKCFQGSEYIGNNLELETEMERSSILNLKHLKRLSVSTTYHYGLKPCGCSFTDFSVFFLFRNMEKLEFLHLERGLRNFSKVAMDHLKGKFLGKFHSFTRPSHEEKIEEVFRSGFTFRDGNAVKIVNLLDSGREFPESEYGSFVPPKRNSRNFGSGR